MSAEDPSRYAFDDDLNDLAASDDRDDVRHPIVRLWKGAYPLKVAYWGWGWFGGLVLLVLTSVLAAAAPTGSIGTAVLLLALSVVLLTYQIVVWVGVWRSSRRHTGKPVWATLAQASVIVGVTLLIVRLVMGWIEAGR
jgi:O-antigen/teichoic acid export membrane protein